MSHQILIPTDSMLREAITSRKNLQKIYSKKSFGVDITLNDLARLSIFHNVSPQRIGMKVEKKIVEQFGWKRVASTSDCGDAVTPNGNYIEIKWCGQIKELKILQIRLYQKRSDTIWLRISIMKH